MASLEDARLTLYEIRSLRGLVARKASRAGGDAFGHRPAHAAAR